MPEYLINSMVFNFRNFLEIGLRGKFYKANESSVAFYICQRKAPGFTFIIRLDNI